MLDTMRSFQDQEGRCCRKRAFSLHCQPNLVWNDFVASKSIRRFGNFEDSPSLRRCSVCAAVWRSCFERLNGALPRSVAVVCVRYGRMIENGSFSNRVQKKGVGGRTNSKAA